MTDREKLIDLVQDSTNGCARYWASLIADHLIENGILMPPVKIGQSVWDIYFSKPREWKVAHISFNGSGYELCLRFKNGARTRTKLINDKYLHRLFFLDHDEAVKACVL